MPNNNRSQMTFDATLDSAGEFSPALQKKAFWLGLGMIALVAIAAVVWVFWGLQAREREFLQQLEERLMLMASSEIQLINELTEKPKREAARIVNADLFRLYAAEVHLVAGDISRIVGGLPAEEISEDGQLAQLAEQLPMMQNLLTEFVQITGYQAARVINRDNTVYLATDATTTPLRPEQAALAGKVFDDGEERIGPLRHSANGLMLEIYFPIFAPAASDLGPQPVAVLFLARPIADRLNELRESNVMVGAGERVRLVQQTTDGYEEVVPWLPGQLRPVNLSALLDEEQQMPFGLRWSLSGEQQVYSLGKHLPELDWWVVAEADTRLARAPLRSHRRTIISFATLLILFFGVSFGAIWAAIAGAQDRRVARHFEALAARIDQQRQLLDRINNTISDHIVLKDVQGRYQYVNPAFARAVGREAEELVGQTSEAVFGYDTARRLEHTDQQVMTSGEPITFQEKVFLQSHPLHLQISKAPLCDTQGRVIGVVSVSRDITEMVEVQKDREQATRKTVEALVRAIELTDPYLAGHSRLMGRLAREVAKVLNASDRDIATVETAANLSQIGKLFIDRNLLLKADTLTKEEKQQMEQHVEYAGKILREIDFGLPVFETVYQMNEGLNGQGYPEQLRNGEIVLPARILGAVNSFCAMVEPRSYRGARDVREALDILERETGFYDPKVVAALQEVVNSAIGDKLLAEQKHRT